MIAKISCIGTFPLSVCTWFSINYRNLNILSLQCIRLLTYSILGDQGICVSNCNTYKYCCAFIRLSYCAELNLFIGTFPMISSWIDVLIVIILFSVKRLLTLLDHCTVGVGFPLALHSNRTLPPCLAVTWVSGGIICKLGGTETKVRDVQEITSITFPLPSVRVSRLNSLNCVARFPLACEVRRA